MIGPTFLVIGAAKCGTTSICDLLAAHPDVFVTSPKEPHFYSRLVTFHQRRDWYVSLFKNARGVRAAGEGSTSYTHPHRIDFVVPRLREELPDVRLIYIVRHPIRRLESDWKMRLREERVSASLAEAIEKNASLITFGLYWKHLSLYREAFPDEQLLVVFLKDLAEQPRKVLSGVYRHIGVDPSFEPSDPGRKRNASGDFREHGVLSTAVRQLPGMTHLKQLLPDSTVGLARSVLTRDFDPDPDWDPEALKVVRDHFREDSYNLLNYCGKPREYWSLDANAEAQI